jgi:hypothetical protein
MSITIGLVLNEAVEILAKQKYQFKHSVKDDQVIRYKLKISNLLVPEPNLHVE